MLGISRIRISWVRSHRVSIARMHGRAKATTQEEEQHQLPPFKIPEVSRGQHEEEINSKHKDWRKFGHRFEDWFDDENYENAGHDEVPNGYLFRGIAMRWLQWPSHHVPGVFALTE